MQIDFDGQVFFATCTFEERLKFRRAGWTFSVPNKRWETNSPALADPFYDVSVGAARERLGGIRAVIYQSVAASMATDTDTQFWSPDGKSYLAFQRAGIEFIIAHRDTLLADQPGLGKTIQALGVINNDTTIRSVIIVVPASLQQNWRREAHYWLRGKFSVGMTKSKVVVVDKVSKKTKTVHLWPDSDIVITTYDMLESYSDKVRSKVWDFLVCDEAHLLSGNTIRSRNIFGGGKGKTKVTPIPENKALYMTGTPITKRPINLWNFCKKCDPNGLGKNYMDFVYRYCGGREDFFGLYKEGATNLEELQLKLRQSFMLRRMKMDVLKDLPPKVRKIVELPQEGLKKIVKKELAIYAENIARLLGENSGTSYDGELYDEISYDALYAFIMEARDKAVDYFAVRNQEYDLEDYIKVHFEAMAIAREEAGIAKVPMIVEYVKTLRAEGEKVVIMCIHKEVAALLKKEFPNSALVTGSVPVKKRQAEVDRFQNDPECGEFIGNIAAAGVGYTLTSAHHLVFAELSWNPTDMEQAEDRIHRIGQFDVAFIHYLVIRGSIESGVIGTVIEKQEIIEQSLDKDRLSEDLAQAKYDFN